MPPLKRTSPKELTLGLVIVAFIWGVVCWTHTFSDPGRAPATSSSTPAAAAAEKLDHDKISAYVMAQEFVDDRLTSPGSAKYPVYEEGYVSIPSPNHYVVTSYVDSQNKFGALLRSRWTVKMHKDGESYLLEGINITGR